ncbi:hypothetical protein JZ751_013297 [Albula glossodonta]|uniref:Uncharacterized protein n=1 Tax=Albula glossodonta TaxID=121402 RepID=A0A8T2NX73_9TELE|nr:hypothetical protein JZ751_013297 [Albula glossodonta]
MTSSFHRTAAGSNPASEIRVKSAALLSHVTPCSEPFVTARRGVGCNVREHEQLHPSVTLFARASAPRAVWGGEDGPRDAAAQRSTETFYIRLLCFPPKKKPAALDPAMTLTHRAGLVIVRPALADVSASLPRRVQWSLDQ